MTWTKLGDDWPDRSEVYSVSRSARLLLVEAMIFANKRGTDGFVTRRDLTRCSDAEDVDTLVVELVKSGALTVDRSRDGWVLDWSEQDDAATVQQRRRQDAERQKRRRKHRAGDHSECVPAHCSEVRARDVHRDATRDVHRDVTPDVTGGVTPPRPDPTRPVPTRPARDGEGTGGRTARAAGALPAAHPYATGAEKDCCPLPADHPVHHPDPSGEDT